MVCVAPFRRPISADRTSRGGKPSIVGDVEGLDFLEGKLERLEQAHQRGVRHVQLVHYTPNDIGDFQTGTVTHKGLTSFGAEAIRACRPAGTVCDVAHATEDTVKKAVKVEPSPCSCRASRFQGLQPWARRRSRHGKSAATTRSRLPGRAAL